MKITKELLAQWVETLIRVRDKEGLTWRERDELANICNFLDNIIRNGVVV